MVDAALMHTLAEESIQLIVSDVASNVELASADI
jgi:hypothetical protein